ncbi:hypothetical protein Bpfe_028434 [Biomphalaria pfeifferi]|uniref:Ubiquitin-like domain-containing protein n=1 Tax=Biomphalaria pfeifferi TaxID=112525 RepID=A0AAD8EWL7_BIOPF|nr:hypothetical protein Bpfe_028434 [Biomphalaria pfeifferi]
MASVADEASPCTEIKFCVNSCSSTNVLQIDCVTTIMIGGLKEDLRNYCNIPAEHQVWTYNNQTLSDERTLKSYGITDESNIMIQISERRF